MAASMLQPPVPVPQTQVLALSTTASQPVRATTAACATNCICICCSTVVLQQGGLARPLCSATWTRPPALLQEASGLQP